MAIGFAITGIDHVQIAAPRALKAETIAFYRDVPGLTPIPKPADLRARGGARFQLGTIQLHIGLDPDPGPLPKSKRYVCLLVNDLAAAKRTAQLAGLAIEEESRTEDLTRFSFVIPPATALRSVHTAEAARFLRAARAASSVRPHPAFGL